MSYEEIIYLAIPSNSSLALIFEPPFSHFPVSSHKTHNYSITTQSASADGDDKPQSSTDMCMEAVFMETCGHYDIDLMGHNHTEWTMCNCFIVQLVVSKDGKCYICSRGRSARRAPQATTKGCFPDRDQRTLTKEELSAFLKDLGF